MTKFSGVKKWLKSRDLMNLVTRDFQGDESEQVERLIREGADVNHRDSRGRTILHLVIKDKVGRDPEARADLVKLLISNGADVNATDNKGRTPLHYAAIFDRSREMELLVNPLDDIYSPLHSRAIDDVELSVISSHNPVDVYGNTPLHYATGEACIKKLIRSADDVSMRNIDGLTPFRHVSGRLSGRRFFEKAGIIADTIMESGMLSGIELFRRGDIMRGVSMNETKALIDSLLKSGKSSELTEIYVKHPHRREGQLNIMISSMIEYGMYSELIESLNSKTIVNSLNKENAVFLYTMLPDEKGGQINMMYENILQVIKSNENPLYAMRVIESEVVPTLRKNFKFVRDSFALSVMGQASKQAECRDGKTRAFVSDDIRSRVAEFIGSDALVKNSVRGLDTALSKVFHYDERSKKKVKTNLIKMSASYILDRFGKVDPSAEGVLNISGEGLVPKQQSGALTTKK